ncbi:uncharacterized protein LOC127751879, partial [Frankliniella occidentalis]|uniref:Uncharacterized protein LOC127751879 n=1 Tax=Frankliniella occidentalis TaxID=133901 RepID=A0A9C6XAH0_FRAOC
MRLFLLPVVAVLAAAAGPPSCGPGEQCVPLPRCPSVLQSMRLDQRYRPGLCGFQDSTTRVPDVCCPGGGAPQEDACPAPSPPLAPTPDMACEKFVNSLTDEEDSRPGNLARRMCRKHQEDLCALPKKQPGVACPASAEPADILEFPHM